MNKVHILGTITKDIEIKYSQSGSAIANFGIAYNDSWKDQQGQKKEKAHFFDVSVFGKQAETINQYFNKGSRILIEGSLDFQSWEKDGQKHSRVGIKMSGFSFIDRKSDAPQQGQQQNNQYNPQQSMANTQAPSYQQPQQQQSYNPAPQQGHHTDYKQQPIEIDEQSLPF